MFCVIVRITMSSIESEWWSLYYIRTWLCVYCVCVFVSTQCRMVAHSIGRSRRRRCSSHHPVYRMLLLPVLCRSMCLLRVPQVSDVLLSRRWLATSFSYSLRLRKYSVVGNGRSVSTPLLSIVTLLQLLRADAAEVCRPMSLDASESGERHLVPRSTRSSLDEGCLVKCTKLLYQIIDLINREMLYISLHDMDTWIETKKAFVYCLANRSDVNRVIDPEMVSSVCILLLQFMLCW